MKKIISAILAAAMCISMFAGITVSAATVEKEYIFGSSAGVLKHTNTGTYTYDHLSEHMAVLRAFLDNKYPQYTGSWDTAAGYHKNSITRVANYGAHGWKYFDLNDESDAFLALCGTAQLINIEDDFVRIRNPRYNNTTEFPEITTLGLELEQPTETGWYTLSTKINQKNVELYAGVKELDKTSVEAYMDSKKNFIANSVKKKMNF